jgi:Tol biopolymer transport system component
MGVVWKAVDTTLDREVAIKVLPEALAEDVERLARFEHEARLLASLSHANIAAVHGLEEAEGRRFLVMELLSGEDLASRIRNGPLTLDEALDVCDQVADALEAAHEKGVIHRDLKPANIQLTAQGNVKVLDFGLAKALHDDTPGSDPSLSPTLTSFGTRAGVILGTASYMSPDQARGRLVDKRTDVWSFGCVLFELLTGRQAFHGETVTDTLTDILHRDPDWSALPANTPASIHRLLRRCLDRGVHQRLRDIGDARIEIAEARRGEETGEFATTRSGRARRRLGWAVALATTAGLVLGVVATALMLRRPELSAPSGVTRLEIGPVPLAWAPGSEVAVSPDGARIVYSARHEDSTQLFLRPIDQLDAQPIPGTVGARMPFFSPDGEWVGFVSSEGELRKTSLAAGSTVALCAAAPYGASWGADDTVVFSIGAVDGLYRVSAAGGEREVLTQPDIENGEIGHVWPQILPGGETILFTVRVQGKDIDQARIVVRSLDTGDQRTLIDGASHARYVSSGHLVYAKGATIWAATFNIEKLEIEGRGVPVIEGVAGDDMGAASFDLSATGTLVYAPGGTHEDARGLVWVDRSGREEPVLSKRAAYRFPRLSPDNKRLLLAEGDLLSDVWVYDLDTLAPTRLTFDGHDVVPVWSADAKHVFFTSDRRGERELFRIQADGSAMDPELLIEENVYALSASPTGQELLFDSTRLTGRSLFVLPLNGERTPSSLLETQFTEGQAVFAPDGRWIAYASNLSGETEVYVRPYPGPGAPKRISTDGGDEPAFSNDGRELFYRDGDKFMAVEIDLEGGPIRGSPRVLFEGRYHDEPHRSYDVAADGRFVMIRVGPVRVASVNLVVALNWFEELARTAAR